MKVLGSSETSSLAAAPFELGCYGNAKLLRHVVWDSYVVLARNAGCGTPAFQHIAFFFSPPFSNQQPFHQEIYKETFS